MDEIAGSWGCNGPISGAKVGNDVSCRLRCGQGGISGISKCRGRDWDPEISSVLDCNYESGSKNMIGQEHYTN